MLAVAGKVIRVAGEGLKRVDETKSAASRRIVPSPQFTVAGLTARRQLPYVGEQAVVFPSTAGTLRYPNNFGKQRRTAREELGVPAVTTHSFRKTSVRPAAGSSGSAACTATHDPASGAATHSSASGDRERDLVVMPLKLTPQVAIGKIDGA